AGGDVVYTFTFSEAVNGFTASDVAVVGGTKGAFTGVDGDTVFTLTVTPTEIGRASCREGVATGMAADRAANGNTVAVQSVQAVGRQRRSDRICGSDAGSADLAGGDVVYTFTFSEAVNGFTASDVAVVGGTKGAFTGVDGDTVFTLTVTPTANFEGNLTVDVAAGVAADLAANGNTVAVQSVQAVDTKRPSVSTEAITSATGIQNSTLNAGDVASVTVTMSEVVTVTGTPQLALTIGGTTVQANYASGSNSNALVFTYT